MRKREKNGENERIARKNCLRFAKINVANMKKVDIILSEGQRKSKSKGSDDMRMSDVIEEFIKDLLKDEEEYVEIQRNELAEHFNCVPSQINYVIATRFTPSQGYYVESKRGGGGHIKIRKVNITKSDYLMHVITSIGDSITANEVDIFISNFLTYDMVTKKEAKLLKVATSDNVLNVPQEIKDKLRANIFKNMLINLVN